MVYVLCALATWRIVNLIVWERGPFDIFGKFRNLLKIVSIEDVNGKLENFSNNELGMLFSCIWCLSPYVGLIVFLISSTQIGIALIAALAFSAVTIIVDKYLE